LCCLLLGGCAETVGEYRDTYVVQPQDTLYSIAWRYGIDFRDLARWNHIGSDFRIGVGQTLTLTPPPQGPNQRNTAPANAAAAAPPRGATFAWAWPTDALSAPQPVTGGGILLSGHLGQDVRAAAAGRVVYTGNGIRGYGNLIILKHADSLLSAYAHNRESLVRDGEAVALGQIIGHMGEGAPNKPVLYFEIRRNGKPIDSLPFLPTRK
jgi:lipoprotein NlpD